MQKNAAVSKPCPCSKFSSIRKKKALHISCYIGLTLFSALEKLLGKSHCVYEPFISTPCPQTPGKENNTSCDKNQHNIARARA